MSFSLTAQRIHRALFYVYKQNMEKYIDILTKKVVNLFHKIIYYFYKIDILLLYTMGKPVNYLVFLFTFFFGTFGSSKNLPLLTIVFKYFCFLFAWYLIVTSIFIFLSFQIKPVKEYLYNSLGESWVKDKIGNPGTAQLAKFGGVGAALVGANIYDKIQDGKQIIEQGNSIVKRYKDMVEQTGKPADPYSKDYKDTMKASREVYQREPKGFLDRLEEKAATKVLVENTAKAWGDWWTGGKK